MPIKKGYRSKSPKVKPLVKRNINHRKLGNKAVRKMVKKGKKLGFNL